MIAGPAEGERPRRLAEEIGAYWDGRARSYSNGVVGELGDGRRDAWSGVLAEALAEVKAGSMESGSGVRACDLGCGPGFFSILLASMGCRVDAVDASSAMVAHARANCGEAVPKGSVAFHVCDVLSTPFEDDTFDLCVSRNVTWLMRQPESAYAEWLRILKPGGKLVVFDANWYRYLVDHEVASQRERDQKNNRLEGWDEDAQATSDEEKRCEQLAAELPLTPILRPGWDLETLGQLGVSSCRADEGIWKRVWTENECSYYGSTPMFMVEAVK